MSDDEQEYHVTYDQQSHMGPSQGNVAGLEHIGQTLRNGGGLSGAYRQAGQMRIDPKDRFKIIASIYYNMLDVKNVSWNEVNAKSEVLKWIQYKNPIGFILGAKILNNNKRIDKGKLINICTNHATLMKQESISREDVIRYGRTWENFYHVTESEVERDDSDELKIEKVPSVKKISSIHPVPSFDPDMSRVVHIMKADTPTPHEIEMAGIVSAYPEFKGKYTIGSFIARGQHSVIYSATAKNGDIVALKIEGQTTMTLLSREQTIMRNFGGYNTLRKYIEWMPNIQYTGAVKKVSRINVLILPFYSKRIPTLYTNDREWAKMCVSVLKCLKDLQSAGYVHRDISPSNFMMDEKDNTVLIDFGASFEQSLLLRTITEMDPIVLGTQPYPSYNAEQKHTQSYADDAESAAFMMWKLRTNFLPWDDGIDVLKKKKGASHYQSPDPISEWITLVRETPRGGKVNYDELIDLF